MKHALNFCLNFFLRSWLAVIFCLTLECWVSFPEKKFCLFQFVLATTFCPMWSTKTKYICRFSFNAMEALGARFFVLRGLDSIGEGLLVFNTIYHLSVNSGYELMAINNWLWTSHGFCFHQPMEWSKLLFNTNSVQYQFLVIYLFQVKISTPALPTKGAQFFSFSKAIYKTKEQHWSQLWWCYFATWMLLGCTKHEQVVIHWNAFRSFPSVPVPSTGDF